MKETDANEHYRFNFNDFHTNSVCGDLLVASLLMEVATGVMIGITGSIGLIGLVGEYAIKKALKKYM